MITATIAHVPAAAVLRWDSKDFYTNAEKQILTYLLGTNTRFSHQWVYTSIQRIRVFSEKRFLIRIKIYTKQVKGFANQASWSMSRACTVFASAQ